MSCWLSTNLSASVLSKARLASSFSSFWAFLNKLDQSLVMWSSCWSLWLCQKLFHRFLLVETQSVRRLSIWPCSHLFAQESCPFRSSISCYVSLKGKWVNNVRAWQFRKHYFEVTIDLEKDLKLRLYARRRPFSCQTA